MRFSLLDVLRCPDCKSSLRPYEFSRQKDHILEGVLTCTNDCCDLWYPIVRGVPRMLPERLRPGLTREFVNHFADKLTGLGLMQQTSIEVQNDDLFSLKQDTIRNFGFEWIEYDRFGWDDPVYNIEREKGVFKRKSLLEPEELLGKLVLDAGCGNGRYTYWAASYGAYTIGADLGDGVDAAFQNTREMPNVHIVQGDIFQLPFSPASFDVIFSIGVLMHTGNAEAAVVSLAHHLKRGGSLSVHVYGKGNYIFEWVDWKLRQKTTQLSIPELAKLTQHLWGLTRFLEAVRLRSWVARFVRLDPHPHCIFDWYAAPIATHHTCTEVKSWFSNLGMNVVKTNESHQRLPALKRWLKPYIGGSSTVTVKAKYS